tara:strand:+ start:7165 stop:8376 length:1212 start_codon:yes stop_codon:yes gene_type:complete
MRSGSFLDATCSVNPVVVLVLDRSASGSRTQGNMFANTRWLVQATSLVALRGELEKGGPLDVEIINFSEQIDSEFVRCVSLAEQVLPALTRPSVRAETTNFANLGRRLIRLVGERGPAIRSIYIISDGGANSTMSLAQMDDWQEVVGVNKVEVHSIALGNGPSWELEEFDNTRGRISFVAGNGRLAQHRFSESGRDITDAPFFGDPEVHNGVVFGDNSQFIEYPFGDGDTMIATNYDAGRLYGQGGNDYLDPSDGRGVELFGGEGNDTLVWRGANNSYHGGYGYDTLIVPPGSRQNFDLSELYTSGIVDGFERVVFRGGAASRISISAEMVIQSSTQNSLIIEGEGDLVISLSSDDAWSFVGAQTSNRGIEFDLYVAGSVLDPNGAAVFVQTGSDVQIVSAAD